MMGAEVIFEMFFATIQPPDVAASLRIFYSIKSLSLAAIHIQSRATY